MSPDRRMPAVRLATWNLLHGRSLTHGEVREDDLRAGATALDADVVSLQEVDRAQPRSGGTDQAAVVADALGAAWHHLVPSLWGEPGGTWRAATRAEQLARPEPGPLPEPGPGPEREAAYGIALVSRWPVLDWDVLAFPPSRVGLPLLVPGRGVQKVDDEPRAALAALVDTPAGHLTVVATHLSFVPGVNVRQLRAVTQWARRWPAPRVLLGDLNLPGRLPAIATRWEQLVRTASYPSWRPRVQFDHVLAHPEGAGRVESGASVRLPVSDHNAVSVTVSWPASATAADARGR